MANTTSKSNGKKSNTKKATAKKKTTNTRNSSSTSAKKAAETRRQNAAERKRKAELAKKNEKIVKEVYLWIFVAVSLLLFLSNFGICGIVGNTLRGVMLGVFGSMGYVFPIILVIVVGLMAYNEANILVVSKITGFLLFFMDGTSRLGAAGLSVCFLPAPQWRHWGGHSGEDAGTGTGQHHSG